LTENVPVVRPTELVVPPAMTAPAPGSQSAQLAIVILIGCGGTQFCPLTVTLVPAATLVVERLNVGLLSVSTVKGPSSFELARVAGVAAV
jgi:hypothetical protein